MDVKDTKKAIAAVMLHNKEGVVALLKKHGVIISNSYPDREIIVAVLEASRKSDRFKSDLAELMAASAHKHSFTGEGMFGFTGENMFRLDGVHPPNGWYGADGSREAKMGVVTGADLSAGTIRPSVSSVPTLAAPVASTPTPKTGGVLSGLLSGQNLSNLFNTGLGVLSTSLTNKSNKELAQTALEIEQEKTKQAALGAASGAGAGAPAKKPLSTGAKIGIALGILAGVGLLTWGVIALVKKGKK